MKEHTEEQKIIPDLHPDILRLIFAFTSNKSIFLVNKMWHRVWLEEKKKEEARSQLERIGLTYHLPKFRSLLIKTEDQKNEGINYYKKYEHQVAIYQSHYENNPALLVDRLNKFLKKKTFWDYLKISCQIFTFKSQREIIKEAAKKIKAYAMLVLVLYSMTILLTSTVMLLNNSSNLENISVSGLFEASYLALMAIIIPLAFMYFLLSVKHLKENLCPPLSPATLLNLIEEIETAQVEKQLDPASELLSETRPDSEIPRWSLPVFSNTKTIHEENQTEEEKEKNFSLSFSKLKKD